MLYYLSIHYLFSLSLKGIWDGDAYLQLSLGEMWLTHLIFGASDKEGKNKIHQTFMQGQEIKK